MTSTAATPVGTPARPARVRRASRSTLTPASSLALGISVTWFSLLVLIPLAAVVVTSAGSGWSGYWDTVTNAETLVANAARRALRSGEDVVVPRVSDLEALAASTSGKVELDTLDDDGGEVIERLVKQAVLTVFRDRLDVASMRGILDAFDDGRVVHAGEDVSATDEAKLADDVPALREAVVALVGADERPAVIASAVEFVLEGLHLSKRLNKDADHRGTRATYRSR